ncbi:hypothetical protein [Candidatus Electronema sp. PJ]|uniref:hypothetical protein n=1 Tax=Candidatus Electronema sp. PJ TaxID=3401572 RepID=UPI003AA9217A
MMNYLKCLLTVAALTVYAASQAQADWVQVGQPGFSPGQALFIDLAVDSNDIPYVAYKDYANTDKAIVMRFDGTNWVQVGNEGFSAGEVWDTKLAIDKNGTPYIAYVDGANGYRSSVMRFDGTNWVQVGEAGFSPAYVAYLDFTLDANGTPYITYTDSANGNRISVMRFDGTDWVQVGEAGFSAGLTQDKRLAIDHSGTPYVAYMDWDGIDGDSAKINAMRFDGTNWMQVGKAGFAPSAVPASLAIDRRGTPYLAYADGMNGGKASVMRFDGTNWVRIGKAGFSPGQALNIDMALDRSGRPHVAYVNGDLHGPSSWKASAMQFNGRSWVQIGKAGFSAGEAYETSLAIDSRSTHYVAYKDYANDGRISVMKFVSQRSSTPPCKGLDCPIRN